jgi:cytochrome c biogenesis protein CcmG/thiol:disulfide interchange protein DsbE
MRVWLAGVIVLAAGFPDPARLLALEPIQPGERPVAAVIGASAPDFSAENTLGESIHLAALRGSPVILTFWATWCAPCQIELPDVQRLYETRTDGGLHVLAINVDEPPAVFLPWATERGLSFDLFADSDLRLQALFRVRGVPQTVLIDREGVIRNVFYGPVDGAELARALDAL